MNPTSPVMDPLTLTWWALQALRVDGVGLGGIWLRAGHGPVREQWLQHARAQAPAWHRLPLHADDAGLLGGIDLGATLQSGQLQWQSGLLAQAHGAWLMLAMAERAPRALLARLTQAMDRRCVDSPRGDVHAFDGTVLALDEAETDEAGLHPSLSQRLGLWLDLRGVSVSEASTLPLASLTYSASDIAQAQQRLKNLPACESALERLFELALPLGIADTRALLFAWRLARVSAALDARPTIEPVDIARALQCVLLPRATCLPATEESPAEPPPESSPSEEPAEQPESDPGADATPNDDVLLAAALAQLPPHLLDQLVAGPRALKKNMASGQSGQAQRHQQRGRPLPSRPGKPGAQARLDVLATLRHAAPRQRIRAPHAHRPNADNASQPVTLPRVRLRTEDFHTKRYVQNSPTCLILALDASGSAAMQRLAQAKGAVQLLLSQSYARRDHVCVIGFRGAHAECLLPPTRSLVRAKRALAKLPGGGGTPLASALQQCLLQALRLQREGQTPMLVMLSDGRANVTLAGLGGRQQAQAEATELARHWAQTGLASLWIDTAPQPEPCAQELARHMQARYLPMPYLQAQRLADAMQREQALA
jgi:magnesium chelatase subunit D